MAALGVLQGAWHFTYSQVGENDKKQATGEGEMTVRYGPGSKSLILDYKYMTGPKAGYERHELIIWNPWENKFQCVETDSETEGAMMNFGSLDGNTLTCAQEFSVAGKIATLKTRIMLTTANETEQTQSESLAGGLEKETLTLHLTRTH